VIQKAVKLSSRPVRDMTKLSPSTAISSPARPAHSALPNSRYASTATITTVSVPTRADETRQPNASNPNAFSPRPIIHLPSGGWVHDPTSHLSPRQ